LLAPNTPKIINMKINTQGSISQTKFELNLRKMQIFLYQLSFCANSFSQYILLQNLLLLTYTYQSLLPTICTKKISSIAHEIMPQVIFLIK
jgi:hypothetical protein